MAFVQRGMQYPLLIVISAELPETNAGATRHLQWSPEDQSFHACRPDNQVQLSFVAG
jgi:hypothetical protein